MTVNQTINTALNSGKNPRQQRPPLTLTTTDTNPRNRTHQAIARDIHYEKRRRQALEVLL
jgi:hypothetical protein